MKRKKDKFLETRDESEYDSSIKVDVLEFDVLIGETFALSELLGLSDRQITAYKATLRRNFWDWYNTKMENSMGFADPSRQARIDKGIEQNITQTQTTAGTSYVSYTQ
jgi:hypothetical protein